MSAPISVSASRSARTTTGARRGSSHWPATPHKPLIFDLRRAARALIPPNDIA